MHSIAVRGSSIAVNMMTARSESWASALGTSSTPVMLGMRMSDNITCGCSAARSEEHTSELQSQSNLVCRLLLEKKKQYHRSHVGFHPRRSTNHLHHRTRTTPSILHITRSHPTAPSIDPSAITTAPPALHLQVRY